MFKFLLYVKTAVDLVKSQSRPPKTREGLYALHDQVLLFPFAFLVGNGAGSLAG
jgi:hypothetical protein